METFFIDNYHHLRFPVRGENIKGFRRAQLGAIFATASHFTQSNERAVIVMPTGSGKTAVLMQLAFVLRARRVLVVTPSVLVRSQITERFSSLEPLRKIGSVAPECPSPNVYEVPGKLRTEDDWLNLSEYDVIVATPNSTSPAALGNATPPADFFDLLLVDEAHHSRAPTWDALLEAFSSAKQVHLTATPFRLDRQDLKGHFVYNYPLSEAYKDEIFGEIRYVPVEPNGLAHDVAVAKKTEQIFQEDKAQGYEHLVMVRTDSRKRANEIKEIYEHNTGLNLKLVHSGLTPSTVKQTIQQLVQKQLDGIVCVDMLGEGFDLPLLKIAAIHTPHKSLAVTLQFIGRFARTEANERIGEAKFVAVPSEIEVERKRLYDDSAVWQEIVTNLSEGRIQAEVNTRRELNKFRVVRPTNVEIDFSDIPLQAFRPFQHAKIFRVTCAPDKVHLGTELTLPRPFELVEPCYWVSDELAAVVFVLREHAEARWTSRQEFERIEYDLFVIYHDRASNLLFINASRKSALLYEHLARLFTDDCYVQLPLHKLNRVLDSLTQIEVYNVGLRRRALHPNAESYRTSAGASTQKTITPIDGIMYNRGHVACTAKDPAGRRINIGYSPASKVWGATSLSIPELIEWNRTLAHRLQHATAVMTGSGLDHLSLGEEIDTLPDNIIAVDWPSDVYSPSARRLIAPNKIEPIQLIDLDLTVNRGQSRSGTVRIEIAGSELFIAFDQLIDTSGLQLIPVTDDIDSFCVQVGRDPVPLLIYLREHPLSLFCADFSVIRGNERVSEATEVVPFAPGRIEVLDWKGLGVNIQREFYKPGTTRRGLSIHEHLENYLPSVHDIVFYDHSSGELADFVTFSRVGDESIISFYHCKSAHGRKPGSRFDDAANVACQVVKSMSWLRNLDTIRDRINVRRRTTGSRFIRGDIHLLEAFIAAAQREKVRYEMVLVQPGISQARLQDNVAQILASADQHIIQQRCDQLRIWGST